MSGFTLRLRAPLANRIDLTGLGPMAEVARSADTLQRHRVGTGRDAVEIGDLFYVTGEPGEQMTLETSSRADGVGAGLEAGTLVAEGDAGSGAAASMTGGRLEIHGNAGDHLATGLKNGLVVVAGSAGDFVGAAAIGQRFGMAGGTVVIGKDAGARIGDRMRRGTIVVRGKTGAAAGARMMGGTIWAEGGLGDGPGPLLRRGTLIAPTAARLLPTYADCGLHDMVVLRILSRYVADALGPLAPQPLPSKVRRIAGDLATIGKGEILLTA